jgi:hypothetical protein
VTGEDELFEAVESETSDAPPPPTVTSVEPTFQ